jgi:hypothetical protein
MNIVLIVGGIGVITALLVIASSFYQKRMGDRPQNGVYAVLVILGYLTGHFFLNGLPPFFEKARQFSTVDWNFVLAFFSVLPLLFSSLTVKNNKAAIVIRPLFIMLFIYLILEVPYIKAIWPVGQSAVLVLALGTAIFLLWHFTADINYERASILNFYYSINLTVTSMVILLLSSTIALGIVASVLMAISIAVALAYLLLPKLGLTRPQIRFEEMNGAIFLMTAFFLLEGYFYADVKFISLIFIIFSLLAVNSGKFFLSKEIMKRRIKFLSGETWGKEALFPIILSVVFSFLAILSSGFLNI